MCRVGKRSSAFDVEKVDHGKVGQQALISADVTGWRSARAHMTGSP